MARKSRYTTNLPLAPVHYHAGIYLRLSRDDGDKSESDSISSQRSIIQNFLKGHDNITAVDTYIDDGYSGTNFDRPDFRRMEQDWNDKKINCIIVKDLSRFGRDYVHVGNYLEYVFPIQNIRFIAINDNYDSLYCTKSDNLMLPIKNVFNSFYAKDIQNKVNSSLQAKRVNGDFVGSFACYGYKKDSHDKHKLVIDEYPAIIVRRIFKDYAAGKGQITIALELNRENVLCPSAYKKSRGLKYCNCNRLDKTTYWTYSTVHNILKNQMYIGDMVQGKSYRKIIKGKATKKAPKDWVVVKGTHEPIIDMELWKSVQKQFTIDTRQDFVNGLQTNVHIFAGIIVCADCQRAMCKNKSASALYYVCSSNKRYGTCSRHSIKYDVIYKIVLDDLNKCIASINNIQEMIEKNRPKAKRSTSRIEMALAKANSELNKFQSMHKDLYEDYKDNLITKEQYLEYRDDYSCKITSFQQEIELLQQKLSHTPEQLFQENAWIRELLKYKRITALDRDIVLKMIKQISVSEDKEIQIIYNFSDELDDILKSDFHIQ